MSSGSPGVRKTHAGKYEELTSLRQRGGAGYDLPLTHWCLQDCIPGLPWPNPSVIIVSGGQSLLTIPKELQQAMRASHGRPLRLTDPETQAEYVLLQADMYDQLHGLLDNDTPLTPDERRAVLIQAGLRAGWDDPEMDVYNDLDPRRQP